MAKARFRVLETSYINDRICQPGEIVDYDPRHAGDNLERIVPEGTAQTVETPEPAAPEVAPEEQL